MPNNPIATQKTSPTFIYALIIDVIDGPIQEFQCYQNFANST
jgi:hypothetical protein